MGAAKRILATLCAFAVALSSALAADVIDGALVEREIGSALANSKSVRLALRNRDFTTARRLAAAANAILGAHVAEPVNSATVRRGLEAVLLLPRFSTMLSSLGQGGPLGGGALGINRLLLAEEYGRTVAAAGSIGLADTIARELLSLQESPSS